MTFDCVICFEEITDPLKLIKTPCGHTFHNSCLTPWFLERDTCPMCRTNYGNENNIKYADEEWDFGSDEEDSFRVYFNFDIFNVEDNLMDLIIDRISSVGEDPDGVTSDWLLNYIDGEQLYCVYSLFRDGDSLVRFEFEYNKNKNKMNVYFVSRQVFNTNIRDQLIENWVFKRRANGYFNSNVQCIV